MTVKAKHILLKTFVELSRIVLGFTFLFSGVVKAVDPLGTAYKIQDYFTAMHLPSIPRIALVASFVLCAVEFLLGTWMILGIYRRTISRLMLAVMCLMTPLTLYIALFNPVKDCGCFGDALILTVWQTFGKNVVLLALALIVFCGRKRITGLFSFHGYWMPALYSLLFIASLLAYSFVFLPPFDFRPYKVGADLRSLLNEKPSSGIYKNTLVYEKDGVRQTFTEENYPWNDPEWTFVELKTETISEGTEATAQDFDLQQLLMTPDRSKIVDQISISQKVVNDTGYTFLMVAPSLKSISEMHLGDLEDLAFYAGEKGYRFYCLTASSGNDVLSFIDATGTNYPFCLADERMLKTMIRANPGLVLLKDGKIVGKWANIEIPAEKDFASLFTPTNMNNRHKFTILSIIFALPLCLMWVVDFIYRRKWRKSAVAKTQQQNDAQHSNEILSK